MAVMMSLVLVLVLLIFAGVLRLAFDVRAIRSELLPDLRKSLLEGFWVQEPVARLGHICHIPHHLGADFFVIWKWSGGDWQVRPGTVPPGADPGLPPQYPGAFEGDLVKTWVSRARL
jgi:hypothetical protein